MPAFPNWAGTVAKIGLKIVEVVLPQVGAVEGVAKALPNLHGADKENAAVALAKIALGDVNDLAGKQLLSDPAVEDATRGFIRAYVALQNVIASAKQVH